MKEQIRQSISAVEYNDKKLLKMLKDYTNKKGLNYSKFVLKALRAYCEKKGIATD